MTYQRYETRDVNRRIRFDGVLLASSSSQSERHPKPRWVEFNLYKSKSGHYIVYRIGKSNIYHTRDCPIVVKNRLSMHEEENLPQNYQPCQDCNPSIFEVDGLYPETPRYWTQSSENAEGVVALLHKTDKTQVRYLTNVAKDLLTQAAELDEDIKRVYYDGFIS